MKKNERIVYFYDVKISSQSASFDAPNTISVNDALHLIQKLDEPSRRRAIQKGLQTIYIKDFKISADKAVLLINKSDQTISDPVFTNLVEGGRRVIEKYENEGQDFSIHMVINLKESLDSPALAICEHNSGLSVLLVQRVLNGLLRQAKSLAPEKYEWIHPDGSKDAKGNPKKYKVNYKFEFTGHISEEFANDLNNGKIHSIELITDKNEHEAFDDAGHVTEKYSSVTLSVVNDEESTLDKLRLLKQVFDRNKADYSKAKVRFKSPEGTERTVEIDVETQVPNIENYVKRAKLDSFDEILQASYESINSKIVKKITALFDA